jgi:hypothetical protein
MRCEFLTVSRIPKRLKVRLGLIVSRRSALISASLACTSLPE